MRPFWIRQAVPFRVAWRLFMRPTERRFLLLLGFALAFAVTLAFSVQTFVSRVQQGINDESHQMFGADLILSGSEEIPDIWLEQAKQNALRFAHRIRLQTMIEAQAQFVRVELQAISETYPLYPNLRVYTDYQKTQHLTVPLSEAEVWVELSFAQQAEISLGETLELGMSAFKVVGFVEQQAEIGRFSLMQAPSLFIRQVDLASTALAGPGSRAHFELLLAGERPRLSEFELAFEAQESKKAYELQWANSEGTPLARILMQAERFFLMSSLLGILFAALAISITSRHYVAQQKRVVATLRAMGISAQKLAWVYGLQLIYLFCAGAIVGGLTGQVVQTAGVAWLVQQWGLSLSMVTQSALKIALATGGITLFIWSGPAFLSLFSTSPLQTLKQVQATTTGKQWLIRLAFFSIGIYALVAFFWGFGTFDLAVKSLKITFVLIVVGGVLYGFVGQLFRAGLLFPVRLFGVDWRLARASLLRRAQGNQLFVFSLGLGLYFVFLTLALRNDLITDWEQAVPEQTPNYYVLSLTATDRDWLQQQLTSTAIKHSPYYPLQPGRVIAVNDEPLADAQTTKTDLDATESRPGFGRELQLTWADELPAGNELVKGQWWQTTETDTALVSVELGAAERIGIEVGDWLTFLIAGQTFKARVHHLRSVQWGSMQPNFFMILHPDLMRDFQADYFASFYVPAVEMQNFQSLLAQLPNTLLIDLAQLLAQIKQVMQFLLLTLTGLFFCMLIGAIFVLLAQVVVSLDERRQEQGILTVLGAEKKRLMRAVLLEFTYLGVLSGLLATFALELTLYFVQSYWLDLPTRLHLAYWWQVPLTSTGLVIFVGGVLCARSIRTVSFKSLIPES